MPTIKRDMFHTETSIDYFDYLHDIWDDNNYLGGMCALCKGDENRSKFLKIAKENKIIDVIKLFELAVSIYEKKI